MKLFLLFLLALSSLHANLIGIVNPIEDVNLSFSMDAKVMAIEVKEGDQVKVDQILMRQDSRLQQLEVKRRKMVYEDLAQVNTLQKNLILLKEMVQSKEKLYKNSQTVSKTELKRNQMQLNKMQGEYDSLLSSKNKEKLEHDISREILSSYFVKSPINGVVVEVKANIGEWVKTGQTVVRVVDSSTCFLDLNVELKTARDLLLMKDQVFIEVTTLNEKLIKKGKIQYVSSIADTGSG
ncbi:HlyD family efflux transporter periplasmic adaptor subunit, partial [bacterium]|nr:HlyD family efflux transporter periplasmic adaptor subunit [bacterium]